MPKKRKHLARRGHLAVFLAAAVLITGYLEFQIGKFKTEINFEEYTQVARAAGLATLALSPVSNTIALNQTFTVNLTLNTGGGQVDGVDVYALNFSPSVLQVVDSNSGAAGVQIAPGSLLVNTAINSVDNTAGKILFSQSTTGGTSFTGSGTIATITFKAIGAGTSPVTFDFTANNTSDTNVAYQGVDQLSSVTNASFTVDTASPAVSITPPSGTLSGTVTLAATASDNLGVAGVQFKLDGANLGAEDTSSPYSVAWNTATASNGTHTLTAVARDAAGNSTTSGSVIVTVGNLATFNFGITTSGNKTVTQGSNVTNSITLSLSEGSAQAVSLSASGLPSGVVSSFSPASCSPGCTSVLTLTASATAAVGTSTVTVTGTAGSTAHATAFTLTVNSASYNRTINIASADARPGKIVSGTIEVLNTAKALLKSYTFTTNSSGAATISLNIAPATVFLKIKASPFLARVISIDLNNNTTYSFPNLYIGDLNQDNIINSIDYSMLNANWFGTNSSTDLNQDGINNSIDYSYMNQHWLITGEQ